MKKQGLKTNIQLNKLKSETENKTGTTLRVTKKKSQDEKLPHELFLTIKQKTKIRNTLYVLILSNMSADIKLNKAQFSKIIQSGGFPGKTLGNMMGNLGKKSLMDVAISLAKDAFSKLANKTTLSIQDKFERKVSG